MTRFLVSATHRSSGKTTVAAGLCAALRQRGLHVQPFKKGPDYIDPMWLAAAAGRACHSLDFNTMTRVEMQAAFDRRWDGADIAVIEGNQGLFDGLDLEGSNSNAALARLLDVPVILVLDAHGMNRGMAPLILGYQAFDSDLRIAGVILNKVGGARHESKLRAVIEHYTDVPVLGAVHQDPVLAIIERHLGLIPNIEMDQAAAKLDTICRVVGRDVDLDRLLAVVGTGRPAMAVPARPSKKATGDLRIGFSQDSAFGFYYPDDLEALEAAGAVLVAFDTLHDTQLPDVDGLFIGGGFPETHMRALEANTALRSSIREAIESGMPAYAECGGLMYLSRSLTWHGDRAEMVGVIPGDVLMHDSAQGRGYVRLRETAASPWPLLAEGGGEERVEIPAHEFHYSSLENLPDTSVFAYEMLRGTGIDGNHDGIVHKNLLANFTHLRDTAVNHWAARFVSFVRACKGSAARSRVG